MKSRNLFTRFLGLAVAMLLVASTSQADAFWASHGGGYGSYGGGSYGSYGGGVSVSAGSYGSAGSHGGLFRAARYSRASVGSFGSTGSYGSTGSHGGVAVSTASYGSYGSAGSHGVGPIRRLAQRIRANRASRASYGSYGASYSSAGSHGGYVSSYGVAPSYSSHGSAGGVISTASHGGYYSQAAAGSSTVIASVEKASGSLAVHVPAGAIVYVNDHKTTSTGTMRAYVSHSLNAGQTYNYNVRVEYKQDGKTVVETKVATLTGGGEASLSFGQPTPMVAEATKTKLTLSVPAAAKVTLAGATTRQAGNERQYITTSLPEGETWDSYTVRVEVAGSTQEKTITLRGGEAQHLVFSFDTLAAIN